MDINTLTMVGTLIKSDERIAFKDANGNPSSKGVVRFRIANDYKKTKDGKKTLFVDGYIFVNNVDKFPKLEKGDLVSLSGMLTQRTWETKTGEKRTALEIEASNLSVIRKASNTNTQPSTENTPSKPETPTTDNSDFSEEDALASFLEGDYDNELPLDDIPF